MHEVPLYVDYVMTQLTVTQRKLSKLREAMVHDSAIISKLLNYVMSGWPVFQDNHTRSNTVLRSTRHAFHRGWIVHLL